MRIFLVSILTAFFTFVNATTSIGNVEKVVGSVKVKSEKSFKKSKVKIGLEVKQGDLITTSKKASVVIKLVDGSNIILDSSSTVNFKSIKSLEQTSGKVYYKITSRDAKNSLKVHTPFSIIGIKGTEFIVNAPQDSTDKTKKASVSLKEGLVGIESINQEFELYREEVKKQFNDFLSQQQAAFNEYKQAQKPGFVEKTKEFDLKAGKSVSLMEIKL
jgi:hypothetical protein